jgi:hypothetical protein
MLYGVILVVIVSTSVADFIVELSMTVVEAKVAVGGKGVRPPETVAVRVTVPLKFMTLVTLIVEVPVSIGPRVSMSGFAETVKSGPMTSASTMVELEKLPLVPVTVTG